MENKRRDTCPEPSLEELHDYFLAELSEDREREVEAWIARSDENAELARYVRNLNAVMDGWTAEAHRQALWHARMSRLHERLGTAVEGVVAVAMRVGRQTSHVITSALDALAQPRLRWQFAAGVAVRGDDDEFVQRVSAEGDMPVHVFVSDDESILVRIDGVLPGRTPPAVCLVRVEGQDVTVVAKEHPRTYDMPHSAIARFETGPGEFMIVLTPQEE